MNDKYRKIALIGSILLVSACSREITSEEHMVKAREYLEEGEYQSAQIELKNATRKDANNAQARYELARVAMAQGDAAAAEASARRAVELGMAPKDVALLIVRAAYVQGEYDRVLAETESFPADLDESVSADMLGYRALVLIEQQNYRSADAVLEIALEIAEDSVIALLAKASYEAQVGRLDTALELASRAVEIDSTSAEGWALIGELHAARGNLAEARDSFDKAIAGRAYLSILSARRAFVLAQLDEFAAADADIKKLMGTGYKKHPYTNFVKGYSEFRQGNYAEATAALQLSLSADPDYPPAKFYLVASLMELGKLDQDKLDQAQMAANQLYRDIPSSVEVARMLASIDLQKEDFSAAQERLSVLLEANESDTVALGMLGSMALMQGDGEQAAEYFERLLALSPGDEDVERLLNRARTMRGDFVSELSSKAERSVAPEDFEKVLTSAAVALQQGRLSEALVIAQNLQQQFPESVEPVKMLAAIYMAAGDWRTGKTLLEDVLSIEPLEPSSVKALVKIYLRTGDETRAEELISAYLQENPQDQEAVGLLSQIIVATREFSQSEAMLAELADEYPQNVMVTARLTKLYFEQGDYERVLSRTQNLSEEEIAAQPSLIELRGKSFIQLGEYGRAAETWESWVKISPDHVLANFYHAEALNSAGQGDLALQFLEKSISLKPDYIPARITFIRMIALSGDFDTAAVEMKKLQSELTRERADVRYMQGWLNARTGNYEDAVTALKKSLSLEATPQAAILLSTALNTLDRADEAVATLEAAEQSFPANVGILTLLGHTYLVREDNAKAESIYRRILQLEPASIRSLNNLAWLLRDTDPTQALEYARRANSIAPDDPIVMSTLVTILENSGNAQEAETLLRETVQQYPEIQRLRLQLGQFLIEQGNVTEARQVLGEVAKQTENEALATEAEALIETLP